MNISSLLRIIVIIVAECKCVLLSELVIFLENLNYFLFAFLLSFFNILLGTRSVRKREIQV